MDVWGEQLQGARVLDLFAGSGAVGIESVSRGAASVCLVDWNSAVLRQLRENCRLLAEAHYRILRIHLPGRLVASSTTFEGVFDLIFADPPYGFDELEALVVAGSRLVSEAGELVVEHETHRTPVEEGGNLVLRETRRYGDTSLSFYRSG
jgi:16S rRNA (guanine966-N2)-methyltransferase